MTKYKNEKGYITSKLIKIKRIIGSYMMLLLLLLSRISRVQLCATPKMAARQAPPSLGFSRQEHWSGLPFPSPRKIPYEILFST